MTPPPSPAADLYRLERTPSGAHLSPVSRIEEATHTGIGLLRRMMETHASELVRVRAEAEELRHRVQHLQDHLTQQRTLAERLRDSLQRLVAQNKTLIGEKRRLRDALIGKKPLKSGSYRIDVDRDGVARESVMVVLDTFPHKSHAVDALREARRRAERSNGTLRTLRLETVWQAVYQRVIDG